MLNRQIIPVSLALLTTASPTFAAVVFSDDFQDDTVGVMPAIGGANVGLSYTVVTGTAGTSPTTGANPEALGNTSSQVFQGGGLDANFGNAIALFNTPALIDGMSISYDFYLGATSGNAGDGVRVALAGTDANNTRDIFMRNDYAAANSILIDGNSQGVNNYGNSVWQNFSVTFTAINAVNGDYTATWTLTNLEDNTTKNGSQAVAFANAAFADRTLAAGIFLEVADANNAADFVGYIDNVQVIATVPEPSAFALAGLGLAGLLIFRRRA